MAIATAVDFPAVYYGIEEIENSASKSEKSSVNDLSARTMEMEPTVEVKAIQDGTVLTFTLVGDNKI